jgi:hypothetical protein
MTAPIAVSWTKDRTTATAISRSRSTPSAMALFGAFTAAARARAVPHSFWPLLVALALAGSATLGLVVALGVFPARPRYRVPVGGMVIGNAMTAAAVALNRLGDDVAHNRRQIEATLAPGATGRQAIAPLVRRSGRSRVIPLIDSTKTTGLIFFPGTMVGMLLAGAAPADAVRLQLVLLYVLLDDVSIAALVAVLLPSAPGVDGGRSGVNRPGSRTRRLGPTDRSRIGRRAVRPTSRSGRAGGIPGRVATPLVASHLRSVHALIRIGPGGARETPRARRDRRLSETRTDGSR